MPQPHLLIDIGAEGGSLQVYRDTAEPKATSRYRALMTDQTPTFLTEDDGGGPPSRRDSGWLQTWPEALTWLGRYPWPNLVPLLVEPSAAANVWKALESWVALQSSPPSPRRIERWRKACGLLTS